MTTADSPVAPPADSEAPALSPQTAARTVAGQLAGKAALAALVLVNTAIITHALGVGGYANWATVLSLSTMLAFALDPGIAPVVVGRIARRDAPVPTPRALLIWRLGLAAVVYAIVVSGTVAIRDEDVLVLALVLAADVVPRAVVLNVATWLQAHHRLHRQSALEALTMTVGLGGLAVGAALDASAPVLALVGVVLPAVLLAALSERQLHLLPDRGSAVETGDRRVVRGIVRETLPLAAAILLVSLYTRIDVVFVSAAETGAGLAQYLLAFRFVEQVIVIAAILAATLLPMLARRSTSRSLFGDALTQETMVAVAAIGALGCLALIALAEPLISLVASPSFGFAADLLVLLAPVATAFFLNFFLGYLLMAIRKGSRYLWLNAGGLLFNLGANAVFTLSSGNVAAARITWLTELLVVAGAAAPFVRTGRPGRLALLRCATLAAISIGVSEAVFAGLSPWVGAAIGTVMVVALCARELRLCAERILGRA